MDDLLSNRISIPSNIVDSLNRDEAELSRWKPDYLDMYINSKYAIRAGSVFIENIKDSHNLYLFSFRLISISGEELYQREEKKFSGIKIDRSKEYEFIDFMFYAKDVPGSDEVVPENCYFWVDGERYLPAEILANVKESTYRGQTSIELWVERSLSAELDEWTTGMSDVEIIQRARFYLSVFNFAQRKMLFQEKRIISLQKHEQEAGKKNGTAKYEPRSIKIGCIRYQYCIDHANSEGDDSIRQYTRHIEAWGVRGHYRKYKNGKVVFIQPYVKGKGKRKDTEYQLV